MEIAFRISPAPVSVFSFLCHFHLYTSPEDRLSPSLCAVWKWCDVSHDLWNLIESGHQPERPTIISIQFGLLNRPKCHLWPYTVPGPKTVSHCRILVDIMNEHDAMINRLVYVDKCRNWVWCKCSGRAEVKDTSPRRLLGKQKSHIMVQMTIRRWEAYPWTLVIQRLGPVFGFPMREIQVQ